MAKGLQDRAQALVDQAREGTLEALGLEEKHSHFWSNLAWLLLGVGLGALTAYMLDPDRGQRRQALVRDQVVQATKAVQREVPKSIRYTQDRLQDIQSQLGRSTSESDADGGSESPNWEEQNNDGGSLTMPTT